MKNTFLLLLCGGLIAAPAYADTLTFEIEGTFTEDGLIEDGFFEGTLDFDTDAPDTNLNLTNVGTFEVADFEIEVFDDQADMVEILTDDNSEGSIFLTDSPVDGDADLFRLSTVPDDFFSTGSIDVTFDFSAGGDPNVAPTAVPGQFVDGDFIVERFLGAQAIANATITQTDDGDSVSTPEQSSIVGLGAAALAMAAFKLRKKLPLAN